MPTGLFGVIICHGKKEIPEEGHAFMRFGFFHPSPKLFLNRQKTGISSSEKPLTSQFVVYTIMNHVEPFDKMDPCVHM
jgi:hypothetical protein